MAIWCGPESNARFEVSFDVYRGFGRSRRRDTPSTRRETRRPAYTWEGKGVRRAGTRGGGGDVETGDEEVAAVLDAQKDPRVLSSHARQGSCAGRRVDA